MPESKLHTVVYQVKYQEQISMIYEQYQNTVKPYVAQLEVMENEFPVEILNEVRSIMSHIAKCYETDDENIIEININKANSHMKRCILDCYKYLCLAYSDFYKEFIHTYRFIDLTVIDNGEFWSKLCETVAKAKQQLIAAKENMVEDVEEAYTEFENAYIEYHKIHQLIENSYEHLIKLKRKTFWKVATSILAWVIPIVPSIVLFLLQ